MTRTLPTEASPRSLERAAMLGCAETIASVSLPVSVLTSAGVARAFGDELRMSWRDRDGLVFAAVGATGTVTASGRQRFARAREGAQALFSRIAGPSPRLLGGFSFEPGAADGQLWRGFGDARFELPRALYETDGITAKLTVNLVNPLDPRRRREALRELAGRAEAISREVGKASVALVDIEQEIESGEARCQYLELVTRARDLCTSGDFTKIVVARSARIELGCPVDVGGLLGSLDDAYGDCYLLTVAGERLADRLPSVLIAASPERLLRVRGTRVETAALAGTVPTDRASDLLSDAKLQLEHQLTADAIAAALVESGCTGVAVSPEPRLRRLRRLVHLETTISARRASGAHIFDIAAALHPTPAVAGIPLAEACRFVRDNETEPRGWYAGVVGWCDAHGEGELAVALRAGLISGDAITLFAGAGIVADSDPETEWAETTLKIAALRSHLAGPAAPGRERSAAR